MRFNLFAYFLFALIFIRCGSSSIETKTAKDLFSGLQKDTNIRYSKRFSIASNDRCRVLFLFGNRNTDDTSAIFVFPLGGSTIEAKEKFQLIHAPCKKIASLSSVYTTMLVELDIKDEITGIDNIDYYNNDFIREKFSKRQLVELCKAPEIDVEKTIALQPDVIFTFGMLESPGGKEEKIMSAGIPLIKTLDHLEETPLARAEWIKCIAMFVHREKEADSIFNLVEKNYFALKKLAAEAKESPSVFTEIKYGDIWYEPGGKSFAASFLKDANANYVWKEDGHTGSLHLSFEEVFLKAGQADFWLNQALLKNKKELRATENRYENFKAYKNGNVYNNIKNTNEKGYSDYWETGILHPDRILSDLVQIFHPELKEQVKNDLYYYKKLE